MERCPICRARLQQTETCPRCGSDLTAVLQVEKQAAQRRQQVRTLLYAYEYEQAQQAAQQALELKYDKFLALVYHYLCTRNKTNSTLNGIKQNTLI